MEILYHFEDIDSFVFEQTSIQSILEQIAGDHDYSIENINFIFCSDNFLLEINRKYLDHDYYTDIITFDNSEEEGLIEADIFISKDRVEENAETLQINFFYELFRIMIHGVLHLVGYGDKSSDDKKIMTSKEDAYLSLLP